MFSPKNRRLPVRFYPFTRLLREENSSARFGLRGDSVLLPRDRADCRGSVSAVGRLALDELCTQAFARRSWLLHAAHGGALPLQGNGTWLGTKSHRTYAIRI